MYLERRDFKVNTQKAQIKFWVCLYSFCLSSRMFKLFPFCRYGKIDNRAIGRSEIRGSKMCKNQQTSYMEGPCPEKES